MLQPYRITFYDKLSKILLDRAEMMVFHGTKAKEDGRPSFKGETPFPERGFPARTINVLRLNMVVNDGMFNTMKSYDPDLVIMQGIGGDISLRRISKWVRQHHKKLVFWTCGWEPGRAKGTLLVLKNKLVSAFFKRADFHLTYSTTATKYVEGMGIDPADIRTCYNGIETDDLVANSPGILRKSVEIRHELELESFVTFLFVGGLIPEKKVDLLLEAFSALCKKYDRIKLIIIGDGPLRPMVEEKLGSLNDPNILFLGRIIDGVDPYFAACDCFVLPGTGGLALNQAMFWGKTCIVGKADGTEDDLVIEQVSGYRFEADDAGSLEAAMERRINENPENIRIFSENSRQIIRDKSNVNHMVKIFSETISTLLSLN